MTRLSAVAAVSVALATAGAWAATSWADPPANGASATVYRTVTEHARYQGHGGEYWANQNTHARRALNRTSLRLKRARLTIRRQTLDSRQQARDYRDDFGIRTSGFLCIHSHEGSWTDPDAPYWGGVQMDIPFMSRYGGPFLKAWGTADHWPAYIQLAVAEYARLSGRGYYPWPTTARACGLLP